MFTLVATLKAKPGKEVELTEICTQLTKEVHSKEKDCLMYIPHVAKDDPSEIIFIEKYTDEQAFKSHAESAHFKEAAHKFADLLAGPPQLSFLLEL
ncbi:MAG: putative quinol monooxygenase [Desulfitobacteriaceae bacterium]